MFHLDGAQILSNGIFSWKDLKCDFLSLSAHKFGGPKAVSYTHLTLPTTPVV